MNTKFNHLLAGLAAGLLAPAISFFVYLRLQDAHLSLAASIKRYQQANVLTHIISLSVLINLLVFFLFLKFNAERSAKGVLGATLLYAFLVLIIKLA